MEKRVLRNCIKEKLKQLDEEEIKRKSELLSNNLRELLDDRFKNFEILGAFSPIQQEPLWHLSLDHLKARFAFNDFENGKMVFRKSSMEELEITENFGVKIKTPIKIAKKVQPDIVLVPGLAFTMRGERLGRGKGFFDQFLKDEIQSIGICFEDQVLDALPIMPHDKKVRWLVTDKKILEINTKE